MGVSRADSAGSLTASMAAVATGIGSLPGEDSLEAARFVVGELPGLPHLPELPARGPGADMVGRAAAHLTELHVDLQPSGWRLVSRGGVDERRARSFLTGDLDAFEEATQGYQGPLKVQCAGPLTLAATIELPRGGKALADSGAVRDLAESLAQGLAALVTDLGRRVPEAHVVVQLDEPLLAAALAGRIPTASGFGALSAVDTPGAVETLAVVNDAVVGAGGTPIAHCCARRPPIGVLVEAGAVGVSVDAGVLSPSDDDAIGEAIEAGAVMLLGLVPSTAPAPGATAAQTLTASGVLAPVRSLWRRLGFPPERASAALGVTPACGLAGASDGWAASAYRLAREAARALPEYMSQDMSPSPEDAAL